MLALLSFRPECYGLTPAKVRVFLHGDTSYLTKGKEHVRGIAAVVIKGASKGQSECRAGRMRRAHLRDITFY